MSISARVWKTGHRIDSPEAVTAMIDGLTIQVLGREPEEGDLPVIPLGWTLITAQRGAAVGAKDNGGAPPASTRKGEQHG